MARYQVTLGWQATNPERRLPRASEKSTAIVTATSAGC